MPVLASALARRRLVDDSAELRMLRSDLLPVVAAVLSEHLGTPGARVLADDLHELIDADLEVLRDHFDLGRKNAKSYCDDWRNAGLLTRRPASDARGETYELSAAAFRTIRMLEQLEAPRSTVTESRLVSLAAALRQLAIDTDPDASRRLDALVRERARLDEQIALVRGGEWSVLDDRRAEERVTDVLLQAQDLPADFARVRARFEELNHELRASILSADDTQSTVLDDVFRGVDLIESSPEGRTFAAFAGLLRDPERFAALDDDITAILRRDFATRLPAESRRAIRTLMREMKSSSRDVHAILTEFARGLRRYVYSNEYQRDRALRRLLQDALAAAVPSRTRIRPYADVGVELELSTLRMSSVGEVSPHDPTEFDTGSPLADDQPGVVGFATLAAIARESEIDFTELTHSVKHVLAENGVATIADVLARYPATQGVASIVGLLSLAVRHGVRATEATDEVSWTGPDGVHRTATIDRYTFMESIDA